MDFISVDKASDIILNNSIDYGIEEVNFLDSFGRILKEDIVADRDFPPFNRVSMDGIAILNKEFNQGERSFKIEGVQAAGSPQLSLQNTKNCIEVMTGAMLPLNTDVVIPYELVTLKNGFAEVETERVKALQNVHLKGFDRKKGAVLIHKNVKLSAAEIGVIATVGKTTIKVAKHPKVMVISTGSELVGVDETPEDFQIRRSNVFTLVTSLKRIGIDAETEHISDDKKLLLTKIESLLNKYDVLLFSGAVSKGKFDFIPEVLTTLGVQKLFHKVQQRPGKPFWFGKKESNENGNLNKIVFAFPGNPVSTFASCLKYFYPWFYKSIGIEFKKEMAVLAEDFYFKPGLTYFLQVKLTQENGNLIATPLKGKGSADLTNLVDADAFLELPNDRSNFTKGELFPILNYR